MKITIELWGQLKQVAGESCLSLELPEGATVQDAIRLLASQAVSLASSLVEEDGTCRPSNLVFVNDHQILLSDPLQDGNTITLMSPIAGG